MGRKQMAIRAKGAEGHRILSPDLWGVLVKLGWYLPRERGRVRNCQVIVSQRGVTEFHLKFSGQKAAIGV